MGSFRGFLGIDWCTAGCFFSCIILFHRIFRSFRTHRFDASSPRLAILPFQNLRKATENDFLCFSLADAIITKLGYISELAVRPSYAVQKYKAPPTDLRRIASELNVDTLLTGTFLREGDDVRITCQLIDVATENVFVERQLSTKVR